MLSTPRLALLALLAVSALALGAAPPAAAQDRDECREWNDRDRARHCEVRELTLGARRLLEVDGRQNGGITVQGWDGGEIRVRATVVAHARSDADARAIAAAVRIDESGRVLAADGPEDLGSGEGWSVSYDVRVPRGTDLQLAAHNGGLAVRDVGGRATMRTVNGGIHVAGSAGDVRGETSNGGISVELAGSRWDGQGLDLETTNGGVTISIPRGYSAVLETGTRNGGMRLDVPVTVQGRLDRHIRTQLGAGGALVRAVTTNGGVRVTER
jgi:hypothetical protein